MSRKKGIGAVTTTAASALTIQSGMTSLSQQYTDTLNGTWPTASSTLGVIFGNNPNAEGLKIYGKTKNTVINPFTYVNTITAITSSAPRQIATSSDGNYLIYCSSSAGFYVVFLKRNGDTYTRMADADVMPTGTVLSCTTNSDGSYFAITLSVSPWVYIYKRVGDTITKLADPATLPTGAGRSVAFSPDGNYLAICHLITPFMTVYKRSGDTFTKINNPATLANSSDIICWSGDNKYIAVGANAVSAAAPFIYSLNSTTDTLTKITDLVTPSIGTIADFKISPDGLYLALCGGTSPFLAVYKINSSTNTFTKLSLGLGSATPGLGATSLAISGDSKYISIGATVPSIYYIGTGDTFTKVTEWLGDEYSATVQATAFINGL